MKKMIRDDHVLLIQPVVLVMPDIPAVATVLEGVKFELQDCALPNLKGYFSCEFLVGERCISTQNS
ncbi:unnamed protein product [Toxocara canis]|uniref:Uncharacterized protein n=1 Tax=Toxocara canis TaxID=6265 RepID=A0A183U930_TOXCA|nr:unnamed protein product [Toxocara canis]